MIFYLLVFQGSTPITEWISGSKYQEYKLYKERVGKFLPKVFGKGWNEAEMATVGPKAVEGERKIAEGKKK